MSPILIGLASVVKQAKISFIQTYIQTIDNNDEYFLFYYDIGVKQKIGNLAVGI